jgi:hypothetical protein
MCVTQTTPSIVSECKRYDFHLDQRGGWKGQDRPGFNLDWA